MINTERCSEYFLEVMEKAKELGLHEELEKQLKYLGQYACHDGDYAQTRCYLHKDFAPLSFTFNMEKIEKDGEYKYWFNGGLIFYGGSDTGVDGPQFSVSLERAMGQKKPAGWEVHT
jgi:hypothetical protein